MKTQALFCFCKRRFVGVLALSTMLSAPLKAQDLVVEELNLFQTMFQPGVTPRVTVSFRVHNSGAAVDTPFSTSICGLGSTFNIARSYALC